LSDWDVVRPYYRQVTSGSFTQEVNCRPRLPSEKRASFTGGQLTSKTTVKKKSLLQKKSIDLLDYRQKKEPPFLGGQLTS